MWEAFGHHSRSLWFQARNIYWAHMRVRAFPEVFTDPVPLVVLLHPTPLHKSPLVQYLSAYHYQCTHALPSSRCTCYWSALLCNEIVPRMIRTKFRYTSQVSKILLFKNTIEFLADYWWSGWLRKYFSDWYLLIEVFQGLLSKGAAEEIILSPVTTAKDCLGTALRYT